MNVYVGRATHLYMPDRSREQPRQWSSIKTGQMLSVRHGGLMIPLDYQGNTTFALLHLLLA